MTRAHTDARVRRHRRVLRRVGPVLLPGICLLVLRIVRGGPECVEPHHASCEHEADRSVDGDDGPRYRAASRRFASDLCALLRTGVQP